MKTKEFKQVTVSGKLYYWKSNDDNKVSIMKDGNIILEKQIKTKPTANIIRNIVAEYLTTIKPVKVLTNQQYGTLGSHFFDNK